MDLLKKLILSVVTSLAFAICTPFIVQASPLAYSTERLAGQDRVETALKISQKGWNSALTVILCESNDYPDSIAATPYAVSLNAPILLTKGDSIDPRVVEELKRLSPEKVILLGGTACLQPAIEKEIEGLTFEWERIGGVDRYETSVLLANKLFSDSMILANGDNFPDALSAATFAGIKQIPIILTSTTLPDSVIKYYQEAAPKHLYVIGGEAVVPAKELTKNNFSVETRLGGYDRYETNAKVVSFMKATYLSNDLFLASGITFPDAVAGTVLASKSNAPLLLTEKDDIPPSVYSIMREHMKVEPPIQNTSSTTNDSFLQGKVTASGGLNLRETPSAAGNVLLTIPAGTTISLLDKQDQWYKTIYQAKTGWVSADYLSVTSKVGTISAAGGLNLRETPSSSASILATVPKDTLVELSDQQGQWYKTTYQTKTGWLAADYVTLSTTNTETPASPSTPINLSVNGQVYILGGTGIISSHSQNIIEGKTSSSYPDNLKSFPSLPSEIKPPTDPPAEDPVDNPPPETAYDPSKEVLINPFEGIPANALAGKKIMIDPGHGGGDVGASGPTQTREKNNNLAIALALNDTLEQAGATVILTRDTDVALSENSETEDLQGRVDLSNQFKPDLFISIHNDANTNTEVQGTSTYYSEDNPMQYESQQLANCIQSAVVSTIKTNNRGVKQAGFYVLRNTTMPSVLLETAFISSPYEEARLQNPTFRKNVASAVLIGIYNYYKNPSGA